MPTNLHLDDMLVNETKKLGKFQTKTEAVNAALREYIKCHSQAGILELAGKIDYYPDYDYKKLRVRRKSLP
jgi:Arc/MetJ family transcription regulator